MQYHLRVDADGAMINGVAVPVPEGSDPHSAASRAVIAAARREHPHDRLVPVLAETPQGAWRMAVVDGHLLPLEDAQRQQETASVTRVSPMDSPAPGTARAQPTPTRGGPLLGYDPPDRAGVSRRQVLLGAGGIGVLALGGIGTSALTKRSAPSSSASGPPTPTTRKQIPALPDGQDAPGGWSTDAAWALEDIADPRPSLAMHEGLVIALTQPSGTGTLRLSAVRAANGKPVWNAPLDAGVTVTTGPTLVTLSGEARVVVATQDDVLTWDASSGKLRSKIALPSDTNNVTTSAFGVWTNHDEQRQHRALIDGAFQSFTLPKDSAPLGVLGKELLAADAKGQVWKLTAGKATGKPTKLSGPKDHSAGAVILATKDLLITGWNKNRKLTLRAYNLTDLKPKWTTKAQSGWQGFLPVTGVSPDRSWAIVANRVVNLSNGTIRTIASKWSTVGISDTHAWGDDGGTILTCTKNGQLLPAAQPPTKVNTALVSGGTPEHVLVTASVGSSSTLYSLPRLSEGKTR